MSKKRYTRRTLFDVLDDVKILSNGCWLCRTNTTIDVLYKEKPTYLIRAIFDFYEKEYNGKIVRSCSNTRCINPNHLWSLTKEEKFWSNILVGSDEECWEWKSLIGTKEYGQTSFNGKDYICHRLAWELTYGKIQDGMCVCHHCDNPPCCNPHHLFLGTQQDNVDDREQKGRNKIPHSLGEDHGNHKLIKKEVKEIRDSYANGNHTYRSLANIYNVSFGQIRNIIKRRKWAWLD